MTLPIGGADMPVVISMYNAFTGLAVALDGFSFVTPNYAMIIAGVNCRRCGLRLLTLKMAKAMNRSLTNVFFGAFGATEEQAAQVSGSVKAIGGRRRCQSCSRYADRVIHRPRLRHGQSRPSPARKCRS